LPTIVFNPSGGVFYSSEDSIRIVENGSAGILPRAVPSMLTRPGFRFMGWFTNPLEDSTRWNDDAAVTNGITLYARWTAIPNPSTFSVGSIGGNMRVTSTDATLLARHLIGQDTGACVLAADLNGDGIVNPSDLVLLSRWLAGHDVAHLIAR
jgi:uncharacterized repeat protein (TIGR02543 family)